MKTRKFKVKGGMRSPWVTIQGTTRREVRAKQNREGNQAVKQLIWAGAIGAKILLSSNGKNRIYHYQHSQKQNAPDYQAAQKQLEMELHVPNQNAMGGVIMDEFDRKVIATFPGKSVRKDLTSLMKKGANVPTYVLEYLLGMYCATDDEDAIKTGLEKIKKILSENYVRPDQSDYVKSKIKENGQYTVIDKVTVRLDESEDKYVASFTNLDLQDFEVNSDLVTHNEKLLIGGIWCIIKIEYVGLEKEDDEEEEYAMAGDRHGKHNTTTISFRVNSYEKATIEERVKVSGMKKQDYIVRSCIYNHVCVVGKKETIEIIRSEMKEMSLVLEDVAKDLKSEKPVISEPVLDSMTERYLAFLEAALWMLKGSSYLWEDKKDGRESNEGL